MPRQIRITKAEYAARIAEARELDANMTDPSVQINDARDAAMQIAGGWIAAARKKAGLTQQQLARRVGMPQSQISRIERNPDRTHVRTVQRIVAALGVDVGVPARFAKR